jgi:tetratricopeptide (TPR) repeat protein
LALFEQIGNQLGMAWALNDLGVVQQLTGDYPAAAASHQQALALFGDLGNRLGQAEALNNLGELSSRTSATGQAREHHNGALEIARDISAPLEEARALEGTGRTHLQDGNPGQAAAYLRSALTIYQHIGAPAARRVPGNPPPARAHSHSRRIPASSSQQSKHSTTPAGGTLKKLLARLRATGNRAAERLPAQTTVGPQSDRRNQPAV